MNEDRLNENDRLLLLISMSKWLVNLFNILPFVSKYQIHPQKCPKALNFAKGGDNKPNLTTLLLQQPKSRRRETNLDKKSNFFACEPFPSVWPSETKSIWLLLIFATA